MKIPATVSTSDKYSQPTTRELLDRLGHPVMCGAEDGEDCDCGSDMLASRVEKVLALKRIDDDGVGMIDTQDYGWNCCLSEVFRILNGKQP